jgi:cardiolipin synthase
MPIEYFAAFKFTLATLFILCAVASSCHALLTKPDPRSAFGWIGLCFFFPFGGTVLYILFGVNRVRRRAKQLRPSVAIEPGATSSGPADSFMEHLARIGDSVTQWSRIAGNAVLPLENGENAFPMMLAAIVAAKRRVWLSTYIFDTDTTGRQFIDMLVAAVARGIEVRVLVDGVGGWYSWPHAVTLLRRAGVRAESFLPPRLSSPLLALNLRTHRKLLLVDEQICFLGGMNIGDRELGKPAARGMSDLHFRVMGPVVAQLAQSFAIDWAFVAREALELPPPSSPIGPTECRVITDGPDEDSDKLSFVIQGAISVARKQLLIMTPYFIPPPELTAALQAAALRGVDVYLVLPQRSNLRYVDWASRRWLPPLLERGVRVFLHPSPFSHSKLLVVDGVYAQIGSANLDTRSLKLNFEIALELYDPAAASTLATYILAACSKSLQFSLQSARAQGPLSELRNSLCWLLSPYL